MCDVQYCSFLKKSATFLSGRLRFFKIKEQKERLYDITQKKLLISQEFTIFAA
jgi:hypothetical protein